jgi:hypothetical protein
MNGYNVKLKKAIVVKVIKIDRKSSEKNVRAEHSIYGSTHSCALMTFHERILTK